MMQGDCARHLPTFSPIDFSSLSIFEFFVIYFRTHALVVGWMGIGLGFGWQGELGSGGSHRWLVREINFVGSKNGRKASRILYQFQCGNSK